MKKQAMNPFLPGNEYIPDGEPRVFGDRVYLYGSHDRFGGRIFCLNDYLCWSVPLGDLGDWRYEGVIYRKSQDPKNRLGLRLLFAPDVTRGADGRYYLYYAFDFMGLMGVAVCDTPGGSFEFLGHVRHEDGIPWGRKKGDSFPFDPAILNDGERIFLYSGFSLPVPAPATGLRKLKTDGGYVLELQGDMVTIKTPEKRLFPREGEGSFRNHEFFEASSIRKFGGKYYFVYSSRHNHELCYALSDRPDGDYIFGGTLISNGDVFLRGREERDGLNYMGNNHGGLLEREGEFYVFYHRHTNRSSYSRQACAEKLERGEDGSFRQAEMTSCGLNGSPLRGEGTYEARIACNLWSSRGAGRYDRVLAKGKYRGHPYFTQDGRDGDVRSRQYIANMREGAVAGYKYFTIGRAKSLSLRLRGRGKGEFLVFPDREMAEPAAAIRVEASGGDFRDYRGTFYLPPGVYPLYFVYRGTGAFDFTAFTLE